MKCLTNSEIEAWYKAIEINLSPQGVLRFEQSSNYSVHTKIPDNVSQQYGLLNEAFGFWGMESGYVVLMDDWNVFSQDDGIVEIIKALRSSHGESRLLSEAPGHWFESDEKEQGLAFARIITAFKWGGAFLSTKKSKIIWELRDEHLILTTKDQSVLEKIASLMKKTGTNFKSY